MSAVSAWEVAIKMALGRVRLAELPAHHADPFDRVLVAQARVEVPTLVSHDRALAPYGVPMIWT